MNVRIELEEDKKIKLTKDPVPTLRKELENIIKKTNEISNFEGMLLE